MAKTDAPTQWDEVTNQTFIQISLLTKTNRQEVEGYEPGEQFSLLSS